MYGMGDKGIIELADSIAAGADVRTLDNLPQTAIILPKERCLVPTRTISYFTRGMQ